MAPLIVIGKRSYCTVTVNLAVHGKPMTFSVEWLIQLLRATGTPLFLPLFIKLVKFRHNQIYHKRIQRFFPKVE